MLKHRFTKESLQQRVQCIHSLASCRRESAVQLREHREKADPEQILFSTMNKLLPPSPKAQRLPLNSLCERERCTCGWCFCTSRVRIPSREGSKPPFPAGLLLSPGTTLGFAIKRAPCQHGSPQAPLQVQRDRQIKWFTETQFRVRK